MPEENMFHAQEIFYRTHCVGHLLDVFLFMTEEEDFKLEDKYYVIDVYMNLGNSDEHSDENSQHESNLVNLGVNKINIYTGELIKE